MSRISHVNKISSKDGYWVGPKGHEVQIFDGNGLPVGEGVGSGTKFYVDSVYGSASGNGLSWETAVTTIELAMALCTANHGDYIWVAAGHNQALILTEVDFDIAGITVIGLGTGDNKSTFDFDHANAIVAVGANNITLQNLRFRVSANAGTVAVNIEAGFTGTQMVNCDFGYAETASDEFAISLAVNVGCNDTIIDSCHFAMGAQAAASGIKLIGASDNVQILNNVFTGYYSLACIAGITTACTNLLIKGNYIFQGSAVAAISLYTGTTGLIIDNVIRSGLVTFITAVVADACAIAGNTFNKFPSLHNDFYVCSTTGTDAAGYGACEGKPLATIDYAVNLCSAGDTIYVMEGHNEGIVLTEIDFDVAGINVIGLGTGSRKPTIDFDHASALIAVGASNITLKNLRFRVSANAVTVGLNIEAGFTGINVVDCDFGYAETASDEFNNAVIINVGCNDVTIDRCYFAAGAQAAVNAIQLVGASDNVIIRNCRITGSYSTSCINGITTASTNLLIEKNLFYQGATEPAIELYTGSTGIIRDNDIKTNLATMLATIVANACYLFRNYYNEDATTGTGTVIGVASADDT